MKIRGVKIRLFDLFIAIFVSIIISIFINYPSTLKVPIIFISILLLFYFTYKSDSSTLIFMIILIIFQNLVAVILSGNISEREMTFIISFKELLLYLVILKYIFFDNGFKILMSNKLIIVFVVILMFSFLLSNASMGVKIISMRQLIVPIATFLFGTAIKINMETLKKVLRLTIHFGIISCLFGLIEVTILSDEFWIKLGIRRYMMLKGFDKWVYGELPGNYYTADLINLTGKMYRRMVSLFTDPLLFSHFIAFVLVCLILWKDLVPNKFLRNCIKGVLITSLIWTFSKGALLILCIGLLIKYYNKNKYIFILLSIFSCFLVTYIISSNIFHTVSQHSQGLVENVQNMSIIGHGLGTAGNYAILYSQSQSDIAAGESYLGTLLGQVGLFGLLVYIGFNINIIKKIRHFNNNDINSIVLSLIIGVLVESILSESAISFIGSGIYFIFAGITYKMLMPNSNKPI